MAGSLSPEKQVDIIRKRKREQKGPPDEVRPQRIVEWRKWLLRATVGLAIVGGVLYLLSN